MHLYDLPSSASGTVSVCTSFEIDCVFFFKRVTIFSQDLHWGIETKGMDSINVAVSLFVSLNHRKISYQYLYTVDSHLQVWQGSGSTAPSSVSLPRLECLKVMATLPANVVMDDLARPDILLTWQHILLPINSRSWAIIAPCFPKNAAGRRM